MPSFSGCVSRKNRSNTERRGMREAEWRMREKGRERAEETPIYTSAWTSVYIEDNDILSVLLRTHRDIDMYIGGLRRSLCSRLSNAPFSLEGAHLRSRTIVQISFPHLLIPHLSYFSTDLSDVERMQLRNMYMQSFLERERPGVISQSIFDSKSKKNAEIESWLRTRDPAMNRFKLSK